MKALLITLVVVALVGLASARPTVFMGGNFLGVAGVASFSGTGAVQFAAYNRSSNTWSTSVHQPQLSAGTINDIDDAGNGVFAAGTFTAVTATGVVSQAVAFWDGSKWCSVRTAPAGTGLGVVCDTETSCWVTGEFDSIHNIGNTPGGSNAVQNFAHYTFDSAANEWVVDLNALLWNRGNFTSNLLADGADPGRLYAVGSGSSLVFFTSINNNAEIWRGSQANNGWAQWATPASISTGGGGINDWTVDGTTVYAVLASSPDYTSPARASASITGSLVTGSCAPCTPTTSADWSDLVSPVNGTVYLAYERIAVSGSTRYILTQVDIDGSNPAFVSRWRVLSHTGGATLTPVGEPFTVDTARTVEQLFVDENQHVVAVGPNRGNLFFPTGVTDSDGVTVDIREADRFNGIALFDGTRWVSAFGGGLAGLTLANSGNLRYAYNSRTQQWFFAGQFAGGFDVHADSGAFFDNDASLSTPFFPLFTRRLATRGNADAAVYDIVCVESDCSSVYVGGDFQFHGVDTYGAVVAVVADSTGAQGQTTPVGGGLWHVDIGAAPQDPPLQVAAGAVYALARNDAYLYAGGLFSRGSIPESPDYVCLNNIARINIDVADAKWEDLGAGCDSDVHDIIFWNGLLIAGGKFIQCGGGRVVNYVASFNYRSSSSEQQWASLNNGVSDVVYSLEVFNSRLIVGGAFSFAGGLPVTGVASWDGWKWRALVPACTSDCVSGSTFYFTNLVTPTAVYDLRTQQDGSALWARIAVADGGFEALGKWQYTDGDEGRWTVAGDQVTFENSDNRGHRVANLGSDGIILASGVADVSFGAQYGDVGTYHTGLDNWVVDSHNVVGQYVYVIRGPESGSASTLSSPLSALFSLF